MTPVMSSIFFDVLAVIGRYWWRRISASGRLWCAGPWVSGRICVVPVLRCRLYIRNIYIPSICIYTSLPGGTVGTCGYLPVRTSVRKGNIRVKVGARAVRVYGTADAFLCSHRSCVMR